MRAAEIYKLLTRRPFVPQRLHLSDGSHYDIRHPEMAIVTPTLVAIGVYGNGDEGMPEQLVHCAPGHVTRLEPIPMRRTPKRTAKRGRPRK
jgi:hypothetical protein